MIAGMRQRNVFGEIIEGAIGGSLIGKVTVNRPGIGGLSGAINAAQNHSSEQSFLASEVEALEIIARVVISNNFNKYFIQIQNLPVVLIDYLGAHCFGSKVDFSIQDECIACTSRYFQTKIEEALETRLHKIEAEMERERRNEQQRQEEQRVAAVEKTKADKAVERRVALIVAVMAILATIIIFTLGVLGMIPPDSE
jgi:hypothetical protein